MKFVLNEIKLWFKREDTKPKSYFFLPDKVNVITGDATTGKTSFWSIIDYCLLSGEVNVANIINEKVLWFGIRFTIGDKELSIVRKTPTNGAVSSEVCFNYGAFPNMPSSNKEIAEIKSILDTKFGVTDNLRFPFGKKLGKTSFSLSYRYFLLFNVLSETIIGAPKTYFDTVFFGKQEYDNALSHIFDLVIGINDMENIKAKERLKEIEEEIKKIQNKEKWNQTNSKNFSKDIFSLLDKCKQNSFIEYEQIVENVDDAIIIIQNIVENKIKKTDNTSLLSEIDNLYQQRRILQFQINDIKKYNTEYNLYIKSLNKAADSLQPIEFLYKNLSDQLVDSYETKMFIDSLESSLKKIKNNLSKNIEKPLKVLGNVNELQNQINKIDKRIVELTTIKTNAETIYQKEWQKLIAIGEIKNALEQILIREPNKPIDAIQLNRLNEEKAQLEKIPNEIEQTKYVMKTQLDKSIQRNYNQLKSLPTYDTRFDEKEMILKLYPREGLFSNFPIDNVGSKSNYMFMHLCVFLGLHEHFISVGQEHVPQFLFIDQPSIPYYSDNTEKGNDDKTKLIDAFSLINSFIDYIINQKQNHFQIFMVEHAPKEYWIKSKLEHFHTVDEFLDGNGLIPKDIYND
ncbi:MAG: DUF3732 domain-containing protein [Tannerella sp.]|jgi:hypothetical protein|nr:DUF3732 domain-containing protein [Tannerella sp.]